MSAERVALQRVNRLLTQWKAAGLTDRQAAHQVSGELAQLKLVRDVKRKLDWHYRSTYRFIPVENLF